MGNESKRDDAVDIERYELRESPPYSFDTNRRGFVQVLGAGLLVSVAARNAFTQRSRGQSGRNSRRPFVPSERFHVGVDGVVTVKISRAVGQHQDLPEVGIANSPRPGRPEVQGRSVG